MKKIENISIKWALFLFLIVALIWDSISRKIEAGAVDSQYQNNGNYNCTEWDGRPSGVQHCHSSYEYSPDPPQTYYDGHGNHWSTPEEAEESRSTFEEFNSNGGGSTSSSTDSGGCFITTAIAERRNLPDDCYILETAREFRDSYMTATPERIEMVKKYYKIAPTIVENIPSDHHDWEWIGAQVDLSIAYIEKDENEKAFETYTNMVETLEERWSNK